MSICRDIACRITPAHAGTSTVQQRDPVAAQDHPRTRGDKFSTVLKPSISSGSPPHTRGQVQHRDRGRNPQRITPAHAGTRYTCRSSGDLKKDHPRTRGDKVNSGSLRSHTSGSPPHTRGQATVHLDFQRRHRITPAHAGTSKSPSGSKYSGWDHPRTRGDKERPGYKEKITDGSPPHTRGQARGIIMAIKKTGITPAHAGTSFRP